MFSSYNIVLIDILKVVIRSLLHIMFMLRDEERRKIRIMRIEPCSTHLSYLLVLLQHEKQD